MRLPLVKPLFRKYCKQTHFSQKIVNSKNFLQTVVFLRIPQILKPTAISKVTLCVTTCYSSFFFHTKEWNMITQDLDQGGTFIRWETTVQYIKMKVGEYAHCKV